MSNYQALARRYRPQTFAEVLGQDPIVTTLLNALKNNQVAHAYLFSGAHGTGKTTLARLLAKALNCSNRSSSMEPCGQCSSCKEVDHGASLNILEIDGASHRGIDDMRLLNETVGYAAANHGHKVYIVDEVHMLTKEAFNALLKTLEEPPPQVVFVFATTEPEKVPATIMSRCQRFHLCRIPSKLIKEKLKREAEEAQAQITPEALTLIAHTSNGGMRDAESILDQVLSFHGNQIDEKAVADILGLVTSDLFFSLDEAIHTGNQAIPFTLVDQLFKQGKNLSHFVENLIDHYRTLLQIRLKVCAGNAQQEEVAARYEITDLAHLIDDLIEGQIQLKQAPSKRVALEMLLSRVIRMKQKIPLQQLVERLIDLEQKLQKPMQVATPVKEKPKKVEPTPQPKQPAQKAVAHPRHDTVIRFAAVELESKVERKN